MAETEVEKTKQVFLSAMGQLRPLYEHQDGRSNRTRTAKAAQAGGVMVFLAKSSSRFLMSEHVSARVSALLYRGIFFR